MLTIGSSVLAVALVVGLVVFLRSRGTEGSLPLSLGTPYSATQNAPAKGSGIPNRSDLSAADVKIYLETQKLQENTPTSVRSTWTPEFTKKVESQQR